MTAVDTALNKLMTAYPRHFVDPLVTRPILERLAAETIASLLTAAEVGAKLGVAPNTLAWSALRHGIGRQIGHSRLFTPAEVEQLRALGLGSRKVGRPRKAVAE